MTRTHTSTINRFHGAPAHIARPRFSPAMPATPNAPATGATSLPARAAGTLAAGVAGLTALPFCAGPAYHALGAASSDPCTAMLLNGVLLFSLVAGAVTGLCAVACGLGDLLNTPDLYTDNA